MDLENHLKNHERTGKTLKTLENIEKLGKSLKTLENP
jgi:hypothetical protein